MKVLEGWDNFYFILGSAAAALIGLTFVVNYLAGPPSLDIGNLAHEMA